MRNWLVWLVMIFFGLCLEAKADALILVHGYFSGEDSWRHSGVAKILETAGWSSGGTLTATARGIDFQPLATGVVKQVYYLADLPSEAPLVMQAQRLQEMVMAIKKQRGEEKIILIGHSAGGVVARLTMVQEPALAIYGLITIAAPHLGTDKAEVVGMLASTPLAMMAPMVGADTVNRSRQLYEDLVRERPGSFLFWLNRQSHPKARYVSLVRKEAFALSGDNTVPAWSQDLTNVAALKSQASSVTVGSNHTLERQDGVELTRILDEWLKP